MAFRNYLKSETVNLPKNITLSHYYFTEMYLYHLKALLESELWARGVWVVARYAQVVANVWFAATKSLSPQQSQPAAHDATRRRSN